MSTYYVPGTMHTMGNNSSLCLLIPQSEPKSSVYIPPSWQHQRNM
jgi:hypothetical protein